MIMNAHEEKNCEDEHLILDISGTIFKIQKETINSFPNSLAWHIWNSRNTSGVILPKGVYPSRYPNRFFIQRSPIVFAIILQCYNTGELHVPRWMCIENINEEMKFWKLDSHFSCTHCSEGVDPKNERDNVEETSDKFQDNTCSFMNKWKQKKKDGWAFFQNPKSSRGATIFAALTIFFIFASTATYVLESIPELKQCGNGSEILVGGFFSVDKNESLLDFNETDNATRELMESTFYHYFTNCLNMQIFKGFETVCVLWFTLELIMRFLVCPNKCKFLLAPLNIIDFMASANIYLEVLLVILHFGRKDLNDEFINAINILRTLTVLRILKFIRYFEDLRLLVKTFRAAKKELGMLCIFVMVTVLIYSCLLYEIEKDEPGSAYISVPASAWWSIVTLTTVGFGDVWPMTLLGKIVGGFACVTGIIIIALPVSVLVEHFTAAYKKKNKP